MQRPSPPPPNPKVAKAIQALQANQPDEAIRLLEWVCRDNDRDAQAWYLLSASYGQKGDMTEVIRCAQQALAVLPNHPGALTNLGNAYAATLQHEEAAECYRQALEQAPTDPRLLTNAGFALVLAGERDEAIDYFKRALAAVPNHPQAHAGLGEALFMKGEVEEAIRHFMAALQGVPDLFQAHKGLGHVCWVLGDFRAAEQHYEAAWRQSGNKDVDTAAGYAATLAMLGRTEEALSLLDDALADHPEHPTLLGSKAQVLEQNGEEEDAYRVASELAETGDSTPLSAAVLARMNRRFDCADEALTTITGLLANPDLAVPSRYTLLFAAGGLLDRLGRYDEAFTYFRQGNEAMPLEFDHDAHQDYVTSLIDTFSAARLPTLPKATNTDHRPIFIVGMPRSGTTLIEQILASHPEVFGAGELDDIGALAAELQDAQGARYPVAVTNLGSAELDALAAEYLQTLDALAPGSPRITDKMPHNFLHLGLISRLLPEATIIHCRRNPLDTCLSTYFQSFTRGHTYAADLEDIGRFYLQYERLMAHWQEVLELPILDVPYEELVAGQEEWTRRLLDHCDLPWDDACLRFHETKRAVATASYRQVREKLYSSSVERWRHYQPHIEPLLRTLAPILPPTTE